MGLSGDGGEGEGALPRREVVSERDGMHVVVGKRAPNSGRRVVARSFALMFVALLTGACDGGARGVREGAEAGADATAGDATPAPSSSSAERAVLYDHDWGQSCVARGDVVTKEGRLTVTPLGKGSDGAWLTTADDVRWLVSYNAADALRAVDGKRVRVRGRVCDKQKEAAGRYHFDIDDMAVLTD